MRKKPQTYPLRYVEDFFGVSNDVAGKLSKCATGNHFHHPARDKETILSLPKGLRNQSPTIKLFLLRLGRARRRIGHIFGAAHFLNGETKREFLPESRPSECRKNGRILGN